ncbi:efflux RND transporter periplasmic adaptor subunit [Pseudomonas syringae]|uniref:efflux RND transporter periplasmic adaptor subunit n=1 Tax=Pseudomonas syringae TaxID=317 RepID=UPI001012210B|nr:efflux RND transporter periplasmic adaptor subunit [Pseudomonas syringae]RXT71126.1 efflux transporter periplasmic adaptor subunit [Pseudomonas syringae]RXT90567.1 efflux transporter periplasmic adaptor subunit [Pseudomonas syringae]
MFNLKSKAGYSGGILLFVVALSGCEKQQEAAAPKPFEVGVITVKTSSVPVYSDLSGRTSAFLVSQVRARVDGIVLHREFTEGANVKAGQRLYKIDPAPYVAALNSAKATLARAKANLVAQNAQVERYEVLVAGNAISKQTYDNAVATHGQAAADVAAGQAAVERAQINLSYTDVVSPISGRIGVSDVTPGAYVQASGATLMATVQQLDPMYVDLTQSSASGLKMRTEIQEGRLQTQGSGAVKVALTLENGRAYSHVGKLQFSDVSVDQGTGSVTVRAVFPNKDQMLLPGMFVRARLEEGTNAGAMLIPQVGITHDQSGRPIALVVGPDDKVSQAVLTTAGTRGSDWVVTSGLKPGDRVIVEGTGKVRPGALVKTVPAQQHGATATGPASETESNPSPRA